MYELPSKYSYPIPYKKNCYSQEMIDAVVSYMREGAKSRHYRRDEEGVLFEREFAEFCGRNFAISSISGTASLHMALLACDVGKGDEVMLTPHVTYAVGNAVLCVGAKPVFVDIDEGSLTMDPIMEIAHKHNLFVTEDGTHAIGSKYKGKRLPVGGDRDIAIFSFNWKQLRLPCGGGMMVTDNEEIAKKARQYKEPHGGVVIGYYYRMVGPAAAVGRIQLRHLGEYVEMQRSAANILSALLKDMPVITPIEKEWAHHAYARYAIRAPMRGALMEFLRQQGIDCNALYPVPTHLLKLYREPFKYKEGDFPVTEKEKKEELSLPEPRFRNR